MQNGRLVMFERIPHDVVEEALVDIAAPATAEAWEPDSGDLPGEADAGVTRS
jgi:hypothetical protein